MTMRVLLTLPPSQGSLHGALPLAAALTAAGHEVAFCSSAPFEGEVKPYGYDYFPAGLDWQINDADLIRRLADASGPDLSALAGPDPARWITWATDNQFMRTAARAVFVDVRRIAESWGADLVVSNLVDLGGLVAAESLGIPYASLGTSAGTARDLTDQLAGALTWLRAEAGLPPDPDLAMLYRHLHLAFTTPLFDGPAAVFPPSMCFLRRTGTIRPDEQLPTWAADLTRPLVLVSLGTVFHRLTDVYRSIVEVLRDEPIELGVAIGFDQDPSCLGPQPDNVHVEPWLPLPLLFPHCAALVTHGGFNSTMEALSAGVPLVVIPMAGDQPYCALRCAALGVGRAIRPDDRLPANILNATRHVLADPSYRAAAHRIKTANAVLPTAHHAVTQLENLVAAQPRSHHGPNSQ